MNHNDKHLNYCISLSLVAIFIVLAFYAPHYLVYSDIPHKSDTIILLVGPDIDARWKEVHWLIKNGHATHLIIPSSNQILHRTRDGTLPVITTTNINRQDLTKQMNNSKQNEHGNRRRYEKTHIEVLLAKEMMERAGFSSAIFVSHPYHMRRIKMIAARVFDRPEYRLYFASTRYEKVNVNRWWLHKDDRQWVVGEYIKILWFLLYAYIPCLSPA